MTGKRQLTVLGSTGSIGRSTLDVVSRCDNISIFALSAYRNSELLLSQCLQHEPKYAVLVDPEQHKYFKRLLAVSGCKTEFLDTEDALELVAAHEQVDMVMAAIVGAAGLSSGLAAVSAGKCLLLANKESLIMSGKLFMDTAKRNNADIIPIDSEHNAIFQCLAETRSGLSSTDGRFVDKLVLTASGGPFLNTPKQALAKVTPEQACAHPKWSMGRKISVDSASLMNKGLELIEASFLFDLPGTAIDIVVHPQSIVHSMVYYRDGSVLAQLANPDMRVPIAYGLAFPGRMASGAKVLDLTRQPALEFSEPDVDRFPCISLGRAALQAGGTAPAVLNAANEIAVAAFLSNRIEFQQIPAIIEAVLNKTPCESAASLDIIRGADSAARIEAKKLI
ncbi:MAG: 1-deoxy-D-xylulose-5-phosphate reductoisomerase [Pseudomonadota bacterium]|nr:1-deoxy-D-xylulose-5-phosphate reductoisomerase [Pseudomonadota bacterium]